MPGPKARPILSTVAVACLAALALAGCASPPSPAPPPGVEAADGRIDHEAVAANIGAPIELDHDHPDAALHMGSHNVDLVAWSALGVELGSNGFANFVLHEDDGRTLAFVAVDGDARGGFTIADITDPAAIKVLGSYRASGSGFQEVRVTSDGRYALQNVQDLPGAAGLARDCSVCIHVVDLQDLANPTLRFVLPVETMGTHNLDVVDYPQGTFVFYVGQPASADNVPVGNRLGVAQLVDAGPAGPILAPVGTFAHPAVLDDGRSFPHDIAVHQHPDGRRIAYVSHWDGGAVTFDVTNPYAARPLGVNKEMAPSDALAIHWLWQEPSPRPDGRTIAWSAPEIGSLDSGTGVIRAYDATDPADLLQLGTWQLPGQLAIEGRFILSPHTAIMDQATGLVAVAHYHAGVWVLDGSDPSQPRALGYYLPHGNATQPYAGDIWWKKPNFDPDGFLPNVYQARWHDGLLWVTERGTGLYALRYTGPAPGPVT